MYRLLQDSSNQTLEVGDELLESYEDAHSALMPYLWTIVIDFSIFFAIYKFKALNIYIHALVGLFVSLATLSTSLPILISEGIPAEEDEQYEQRHFIIGLVVVILIFLQALMGITTKTLQLIRWSHPYLIFLINVGHKYLGYGLLILCKVQVFLILNLDEEEASVFWGLIVAEAVMLLAWTLCKVLFYRLEETIAPKYDSETIPSIDSLAAVMKEHPIIGVFANYVYDLQPLLHSHPCGFRIVESVKGVDLDRFLYGMYSPDRFPRVPTNSHGFKSLSLLDTPIAKISIPAVYAGLEVDTTEVVLQSALLISRHSAIYELRLKKKTGRFVFNGYTSLKQLGRYYSLTADNKTTRLYTTVGFLDPKNASFLNNELSSTNVVNVVKVKTISNDIVNEVPQSERILDENDNISLLIKCYPTGNLSPKLTQQQFQTLHLSEPRGQGLGIHELTPGKVIIVAGGTGLYPFCDLIDLLFKECVSSTDKVKQHEIYMSNPVLGSKPFEHFRFHLLLAVQQIEDIHPTTLMQLAQLSKRSNKFQLTMRVSHESQEFKNSNKMINFTSERFDSYALKEMELQPYRKVWICGPPPMTASLIDKFDSNKISQDNYRMI